MKKTLIFRSINYSNFWFCYLLSFFWKIGTLNFQNIFGYLADGAPNAPFEVLDEAKTFIFAFGGLTLIILMSAISALLWHWRIIPILVNALAVIFKKPLNVGGPVGLSATANVFLGQVEAP